MSDPRASLGMTRMVIRESPHARPQLGVRKEVRWVSARRSLRFVDVIWSPDQRSESGPHTCRGTASHHVLVLVIEEVTD